MKVRYSTISLFYGFSALLLCSILIYFFLYQTDRSNYELIYQHTPQISQVSSIPVLMSAQSIIGASYDLGFILLFSILKLFVEYQQAYLFVLFIIITLTLFSMRIYNKHLLLPILLYISTQSWIDANIIRQALAQSTLIFLVLTNRRFLLFIPPLLHKSILIFLVPSLAKKIHWDFMFLIFISVYTFLTYVGFIPDFLGISKYALDSSFFSTSSMILKSSLVLAFLFIYRRFDTLFRLYLFGFWLILTGALFSYDLLRLFNFLSYLDCFLIPSLVYSIRNLFMRQCLSLLVFVYATIKFVLSYNSLNLNGLLVF